MAPRPLSRRKNGRANGAPRPHRAASRTTPYDYLRLDGIQAYGHLGVTAKERELGQRVEVDVELALNLQHAGLTDDLALTADYSRVFEVCRQIVESTRFRLIEALAEAIAQEVLAGFPADEVTVRIRKPAVDLGGTFRSVGIEIQRRRPG